MSLLVKQLDKLLKTKSKLYNEYREYPENCTLIYILIELVNENYDFTISQFNSFVEQASHENYGAYSFFTSQLDEHKLIIKYMLMKFDLTEEQFSKICLSRGKLKNSYCIDILFEKKYNFTLNNFEQLYDMSYNVNLNNNYDMIHNNVIFSACMYLLTNKNSDNFNKCLELLSQNTNSFNIEYLNIILCIIANRICRESQNIYVLLDAIFLNHNDGDEILQLVASKKYTIRADIINYIINKFGYNDMFIEYIFNIIINHNAEFIFTLIHKGFKLTIDFLNKLLDSCSVSHLTLLKDKLELPELLSNKYNAYKITENIIKIPIVDLFRIYNLQPDINTLNIACKKEEYDLPINTLLTIYKIIPEKETLDIAVTSLNYDLVNKIINYKLTPDTKTLRGIPLPQKVGDNYKISKIIDLLIGHGLKIAITDVEYLLSIHFILENLERFDIEYNEQLYFICYLNNEFPDEYMKKFTIDSAIFKMHTFCRSRKLTYEKLIDYLKNNNIKLDRYSLDILIMTYPAIARNILRTYYCVPSVLSAYKKTYTSCGLTITLETLANTYNITSNDMFKQYDMKFI